MKHEQYKETLLGAKQQRHGMNILRSEGHEIYGMHMKKISLSPFDSKRWIDDDGIQTKTYGFTKRLPTFTEEWLAEMEARLLALLGVNTDEEFSQLLGW